MSQKIRLHQYLSQTGLFRTKTDVFNTIRSGRIYAKGKTVTNPDFQIRKNSEIEYDGKRIKIETDKVYILMNKPKGYISSKLKKEQKDLNKKSMMDLVKVDEKIKNTLFCIGRLDEDSSGLIIITNDGSLSNLVAKPESEIEKTYFVKVKNPVEEKQVQKIREGIVIDLEENGKITKYRTKPCKINRLKEREYEITITEGKKRELRRMFEAVGNKVVELIRESIGNIILKELKIKEGQYIAVDKDYIISRVKSNENI